MAQIIKNRFIKITLWLIAGIILLFFLVAITLQFPYVQTKIVNKLSSYLSEKTGFSTTIAHVSIDWMDQISLEGVSITDLNGFEMAFINQATINYQLKSLNQDNSLHFDELVLDSANIFLTKNQINDSVSDLNLNILIRNIRELTSKPKKEPKLIQIGNVNLKRSNFSYHNPDKDSLFNQFDYQHFTFNDIDAQMSDFSQRRDTVTFNLSKLSGQDKMTSLKVTDLQTKFSVSQKQMVFEELEVRIGESKITQEVIFNYTSLKSMSDFNNLVNIEAHLKDAIIFTDDLALFSPGIYKHHQKIICSGDFKGKMRRFSFNNFDIEINGKNRIQGKINLDGLPDLAETFIDLKVSNANIDASHLHTIFKPKTLSFLSTFGRTQFNGDFVGYINDFVAAGTFNTQMGKVVSNINLKVAEEIGDSKYSGHLEMFDFDLGEFSGRDFFQKVSLNGEISGKGLNFSTADFELAGEIEKIGIYNYEYTNIKTDAHFAKEFFEGTTSIDDPNLKFTIDGFIDMREGKDSYQANLGLKKAVLKPLNLSKYNLVFFTDASIDARGLKIDSISGEMKLRNTFIEYDGKPLFLDSLFIETSRNEKNTRGLSLSSSLFDATIEGAYNYSTAVKNILTLLKEYQLNLVNDQSSITSHYANKERKPIDRFSIDYKINLKNFTPIIQLFNEDISLSKNTVLEGIYSNGHTSILSINSKIDTLSFQNNHLNNLVVDITTSKISDATNVLAMGFISSTDQQLANNIVTENLVLESIWDNNQIDFGVSLEQEKHANRLSISGMLDFLSDTTIVHFDESSIQLFDNYWKFDKKNQISLLQDEIQFSDFSVFNDEQNLSVNGSFSTDPSKRAIFNFNNIDISIINPIITKNVKGSLNGFMEVKDYANNPSIENDITIDDFFLDNFLIGDFYAKTQWKENNQSFKIKAFLDRENRRTINVNGYYHPQDQISPLDLRANIDNTSISIIEPFLDKFFSNIEGQATGVFKITGQPKAPIINGEGDVSKGQIHVNYLNTSYTFDGGFGFTSDKIMFNNISLNDALNSKANLSGNISHKGFKNMEMNLKTDLTSFQVLNTSSVDNELFYGQGYATGQISFDGPVRNMTINASAKSTKGTKIYIPIGDTDNIQQEEYINFTNFISDTVSTGQLDISESIDLKGLTMNFDLDITPDAYCELIFDIKSGDIIRGRGNGQINLQIDTYGEFNMFGDYILDQGGYNFTLYNIINKEFNLLPESKISWFGDPYQGILDMSATYGQITSLSPLVDTTFQSIPAIRRGYPVDVELMLDGPLLSPTIDFDINIKDYPATITDLSGSPIYLEDVVTDLESRISTDEHELNRQVFSLIVLRKFSPPQSFNTAGSVGNSVSEFISNQLSYWVSQVDENLEVDVDLGKLDDEAFNTFQLRLSYTFLDGRLRVTREGGFNNQNQDQDVSGIVGDWTVEYMLTSDGKLRAKMYNRTNYNALNSSSLNSTATITTGFSLSHTQDFNTIRELLTNERKKQRNQQKKDTLTQNDALRKEE